MTEIINIFEERSVEQYYSSKRIANLKEIDEEISEIENIIDSPTYGEIYCHCCQSDNVDCAIEQSDEKRFLQCVCLECYDFWCEQPEENIQDLRDRLAWLVTKRESVEIRLKDGLAT
ncbi:hypothetical protein ACFL1N_09495 [Thermodesulfobacteriota bacterium]